MYILAIIIKHINIYIYKYYIEKYISTNQYNGRS